MSDCKKIMLDRLSPYEYEELECQNNLTLDTILEHKQKQLYETKQKKWNKIAAIMFYQSEIEREQE